MPWGDRSKRWRTIWWGGGDLSREEKVIAGILHRLVRSGRAVESLFYRLFLGRKGQGLPVLQATWEAQYRTGHWDIFDSIGELHRYSVIAGYIRSLFSSPSILDVGCGYGRLLVFLQGVPFKQYVGIDLSSEAINRARLYAGANITLETADFTEWDSPSRFEAIVFNESLYYARYPVGVLLRYAGLLEPDGVIIVSMFRHKNTPIIWKDIEKHFAVVDSVEVKNRLAEVIDIKALRRKAV